MTWPNLLHQGRPPSLGAKREFKKKKKKRKEKKKERNNQGSNSDNCFVGAFVNSCRTREGKNSGRKDREPPEAGEAGGLSLSYLRRVDKKAA